MQAGVATQLWAHVVRRGAPEPLRAAALRLLGTFTRSHPVSALHLLEARHAVSMLVHMLTQPEGMIQGADGTFVNTLPDGAAAPPPQGAAAEVRLAAAQLLAEVVSVSPECLEQVRQRYCRARSPSPFQFQCFPLASS